MPRSYEILEHTADQILRARGRSPEELLRNLAKGFYLVALGRVPRLRNTDQKPLELRAPTMEDLVVQLLNEQIFFLYAKHLLALPDEDWTVELDGEDWVLRGSWKLAPHDAEKYPPRTEIKSATYHNLEVQAKGALWETQVTLDI